VDVSFADEGYSFESSGINWWFCDSGKGKSKAIGQAEIAMGGSGSRYTCSLHGYLLSILHIPAGAIFF